MEMIERFHEMNKEMIEILSKVPRVIIKKEDELYNIEHEINDIKHVMEMAKLNASQGYNLYMEMKTALLKRRKLKDDLKELRYIKNAMDDSEGKLLTPMKNLNYSLNQFKQNKEARSYSLRVRADFLPLYGDKCSLVEDTALKKKRRKEMNLDRRQMKKSK